MQRKDMIIQKESATSFTLFEGTWLGILET